VAHLEYFRDFGFPFLLKFLDHERETLLKYSEKGEEQRRRAQSDLLSFENSIKARRGGLEGLKNAAVMDQKRKDEDALKKKIAANPKMQKEYADAWAKIAKARKYLPSYEVERRMLDGAWAFSSDYFQLARALVRLATESAKPNAERLPGFTDAARASLELRLYSPAPIYDEFEEIKLANSLKFMRDEMGQNNVVVQKVLMGKTPEARAKELIEGTKLKDVEYRKQVAAGGVKAIEESTDPMIVLARSIDLEARAVRKRYDEEVIGVEREVYAKIAKAKFELYGTSVYPDATFTLRLSYGAVKGYTSKGKSYGPFTDFAGLYQHSVEHGNKDPFKLAES
jgi:hypothetical protein